MLKGDSKNYLARIGALLIGNLLLGASIGFFRIVDLGTDPFSSMIIGLNNVTGISFGTVQLIVLSLMFLAMLLFKRENIGLGTLPSIFMNGYISDFVYFSLQNTAFDTTNFILKIIILVFALIICTLGIAIYIETYLGMASYDTLAIIIEDRTKISFKTARVLTDVTCLAIGVIFGASIGINTVIMAVFTGILIGFFRKLITTNHKFNKFLFTKI